MKKEEEEEVEEERGGCEGERVLNEVKKGKMKNMVVQRVFQQLMAISAQRNYTD